MVQLTIKEYLLVVWIEWAVEPWLPREQVHLGCQAVVLGVAELGVGDAGQQVGVDAGAGAALDAVESEMLTMWQKRS